MEIKKLIKKSRLLNWIYILKKIYTDITNTGIIMLREVNEIDKMKAYYGNLLLCEFNKF